MSNGWFLVKYIDDVFRNEPINIGVVVTSGNEMGSHFLGQRPDGSINGQRISKRISGVETYKAWVRFINKEAARGNLDVRIEALSKRVGESYVIERRGPILGSAKSPQEVADELFVALVSADTTQAQSLDNLADSTFKQLLFPAGRKIERDVDFKVKVRNVPQLVTFDYRYAADHTVLMDRISFSRAGKPLAQSINDLLYRIEVTEEQQDVESFVALYSGADFSPQTEAQLRLLDRFAYTVDLNSESARQDLGTILGVPVLA
ncbi:hypothetical protein AB0G76_38800 [Streptomyces asoensis]|uniref:hypothetical protein n=1 Tax=Streptomyces asoensis TaxID=249586 RepID=UPI0033FA0C54